ncbi:MAG TPA: hypothetical protein VEA92_03480 [Candidatus Paceibacterota bacterium]|nr:hypothetical protein [Candidatus Paceibacterota bacterium]
MMTPTRGFALLVSILLATVAVTLGVSLIDIAYKQVVLSSTAKQSQFGFYAADSALECALYWDQKYNAFRYTSPMSSGSLACNGYSLLSYSSSIAGSGSTQHRRTRFNVRCASSGSLTNAQVTVYKYQTGSTTIYANGYSTCNAADQRRVERGLKVFY